MGLNKSELTSKLHNGDGICFHLDREKKTCTIYEDRPYFCRIEEGYDNYFKDTMTKEEFYRLNYEACEEKKRRWMECGQDPVKFAKCSEEEQLPEEYDEVLTKRMNELIENDRKDT